MVRPKREATPGSRWCIDYEDQGCTLNDLQQALQSLSSLDATAQICVYAGGLLKGQVGNSSYPWLAKYPLWLAQYTTGTPTWPTQIWPYYTMWQFTGSGSIAGVTGDCDLDTFNGTVEGCAAWFGPTTQPAPGPTPSPTPSDSTVSVNITAPADVTVNVSINGKPIGPATS